MLLLLLAVLCCDALASVYYNLFCLTVARMKSVVMVICSDSEDIGSLQTVQTIVAKKMARAMGHMMPCSGSFK